MMQSNFRMNDEMITMIKGDTLSFNFSLLDKDGNPLDYDLESASFTCKEKRTDQLPLFSCSLGDGISKVSEGIYCVRVDPSKTESDSEEYVYGQDVLPSQRYFYDLEIKVNGDTFTLMHGILEVEEGVTNKGDV